eukprot:CAMPEP_0169427010 /NCGR_PEP_ID=MMETSP1042-20121227/535_1 /TAXON_ID=464988 /ORGANISM="Hemiselmis andersenii, Strain CCMP1180" /LENGTH=178 /DNA_ID=CAMNT_0009537025 /DNA_START=26 /DNA_END=558 /DNA_ORIENTATION=-
MSITGLVQVPAAKGNHDESAKRCRPEEGQEGGKSLLHLSRHKVVVEPYGEGPQVDIQRKVVLEPLGVELLQRVEEVEEGPKDRHFVGNVHTHLVEDELFDRQARLARVQILEPEVAQRSADQSAKEDEETKLPCLKRPLFPPCNRNGLTNPAAQSTHRARCRDTRGNGMGPAGLQPLS